MQITESQVRRIIPAAKNDRIKEFVASFNKYAEQFGIDTKLRVAGYLSQVFHETGALSSFDENMNYSAKRLMQVWPKRFPTLAIAQQYEHNPEKLANYVYANRMGNGDEASGDGWRFHGRGFLGTTGRDNYQKYADSEFCLGDLMAHPEWLAKQPGCQKSAMFFWYSNNLNRFADRDDIRGLSKAVNGGTLGLSNRMYLYRQAKKVLGI